MKIMKKEFLKAIHSKTKQNKKNRYVNINVDTIEEI